ncbi:MAG: NUDIX domain-containing protein [Nanoarchaeota archaeon]|nr:NUDIX domain-containing protein [Nanoarchaeota archaeon]
MQITREFLSTVFVVQDNKVLLNFNNKCQIWVPVGGHIEKDELPCQSVIREAKEESGLDIELVDPYQRPVPSNLIRPVNLQLDHIKEDHKHINLIYFARVVGGTFTEIADDGAPSKWFTLEDLKTEPKNKLIPEIKLWAIEALKKLS